MYVCVLKLALFGLVARINLSTEMLKVTETFNNKASVKWISFFPDTEAYNSHNSSGENKTNHEVTKNSRENFFPNTHKCGPIFSIHVENFTKTN